MGAHSLSVNTLRTIGRSEPWHVTKLAIWMIGSLSAWYGVGVGVGYMGYGPNPTPNSKLRGLAHLREDARPAGALDVEGEDAQRCDPHVLALGRVRDQVAA